jgi:hypothetical protein
MHCNQADIMRCLAQIAALKALKLNIRRAKVKTKGNTRVNKFFITDATTAEKIMKSARLEEIRLSILNNLIKYHPESGRELGWGAAAPQDDTSDILHPLGAQKMCAFCTPHPDWIVLNVQHASSTTQILARSLAGAPPRHRMTPATPSTHWASRRCVSSHAHPYEAAQHA